MRRAGTVAGIILDALPETPVQGVGVGGPEDPASGAEAVPLPIDEQLIVELYSR